MWRFSSKIYSVFIDFYFFVFVVCSEFSQLNGPFFSEQWVGYVPFYRFALLEEEDESVKNSDDETRSTKANKSDNEGTRQSPIVNEVDSKKEEKRNKKKKKRGNENWSSDTDSLMVNFMRDVAVSTDVLHDGTTEELFERDIFKVHFLLCLLHNVRRKWSNPLPSPALSYS